ncbi:hypothetical protein NIES2100_26170 [Calothrix sp. NIES-2100]|nr:hypothetical protein NIES2100_26170 [Calothrix sp. NIES-2100]
MQMTTEEYLQWSKLRAIETLEYYKSPTQAFLSLCSDLGKHPELKKHLAIELGTNLLLLGKINTIETMRRFIEDCN